MIDSMDIGGAEKVFLRDMQHIRSLGNDVFCILLSYERSLNCLLSEVGLPDNHVFLLRKFNLKFWFLRDCIYRPVNKLYNVLRICIFLKKSKIEIVYATLDNPIVLSKVVSWLLPAVTFFTREAAIPKKKSALSCLALDVLGLRIKKSVAVSESVKASLIPCQSRAKNIFVLKNSVPDSKVLSDCLASVKYVVFVGSLKPIKMTSVLIDAVPQLISKYADIKLLLIGDGCLKEKLVLQVENLGIASNVVFMGRQNRDILHTIYSKSVIFVMPSENEGCPNALLEAMSCGVPCVGSDAPGIIEVLDGGRCGRIFPRNNSEMLANVLSELLSSSIERQRLGNAAQQRVRESYGDREHFKQLEELFSVSKV